jgi:hypothetical protein
VPATANPEGFDILLLIYNEREKEIVMSNFEDYLENTDQP